MLRRDCKTMRSIVQPVRGASENCPGATRLWDIRKIPFTELLQRENSSFALQGLLIPSSIHGSRRGLYSRAASWLSDPFFIPPQVGILSSQTQSHVLSVDYSRSCGADAPANYIQ